MKEEGVAGGLRFIWLLIPRQDAGGTNVLGGINNKGQSTRLSALPPAIVMPG